MKQVEQPVKVLYDSETDILYLHFMDGTAEEVLEAGDNVYCGAGREREDNGNRDMECIQKRGYGGAQKGCDDELQTVNESRLLN